MSKWISVKDSCRKIRRKFLFAQDQKTETGILIKAI